ncbi:hypothetical protein QN277_018589 [Acacia crassicarpa]|uniref:Uncharacterized protein n=1 Tax=Acacia crassicarpa TaxID=499986 RepID=A0AAE1JUV1_9FABA|nr:hypothetical protein QN277_018589 [Acacia crassicarpa]
MLETKFGELIVQLDLSVSWTFGVKWSSKGKTLAYAGQNSIMYFVNGIGSSSPPETQTVAYRHLPLCDVCFISENMVIGVGFDCVPLVFAKGEGDKWKFIRSIGEIRARSPSLYGSQFDIFGRFIGRAQDEVTVETSEESGGSHDKCINCVLPLRGRGTLIKRFSTSGLDGRVIIWDLEKQEDLAEYILGPL